MLKRFRSQEILQLLVSEITHSESARKLIKISCTIQAHAKDKHLSLFEKIAAEHARIGEEQLAQRLAFEATSIRNEADDSEYQQ